jgi:hypothetical protein
MLVTIEKRDAQIPQQHLNDNVTLNTKKYRKQKDYQQAPSNRKQTYEPLPEVDPFVFPEQPF